jgi:prevent-host-death family protein
MVMSKTALAKKKKPKVAQPSGGMRQMAAGEFKAKCLAIMDEVNETGRPLLVTKRGEPSIKVFPARNGDNKKKGSILGRLEGIIKINGDPDDLVKPIFPLEDWDMLK